MIVTKLGVSKLGATRLNSRGMTDIDRYRQRLRVNAALSEFDSTNYQLNKEGQEYVDALKKYSEDLTEVPWYYGLEDNKIIELSDTKEVQDLIANNPELLRQRYESGYYADYFKANPEAKDIVDRWYYDKVVGKEGLEYRSVAQKASDKSRRLQQLGYPENPNFYSGEANRLLTLQEEIKQSKEQNIEQYQSQEKDILQGEIKINKEQFVVAVGEMPLPIGKDPYQYGQELYAWEGQYGDVLGRNYSDTMSLLSGNIQLTPEELTSAQDIILQLSQFSTYKGGSAAYSQRLLSKSPNTVYLSLGQNPVQIVQFSFLEGKYQEFNPSTFEISTKQATVTGWTRVGQPKVETKLLSTKQITVPNVMVKQFVIQQNLPKWGYKGNYSQDLANKEKNVIMSRLDPRNALTEQDFINRSIKVTQITKNNGAWSSGIVLKLPKMLRV